MRIVYWLIFIRLTLDEKFGSSEDRLNIRFDARNKTYIRPDFGTTDIINIIVRFDSAWF